MQEDPYIEICVSVSNGFYDRVNTLFMSIIKKINQLKKLQQLVNMKTKQCYERR